MAASPDATGKVTNTSSVQEEDGESEIDADAVGEELTSPTTVVPIKNSHVPPEIVLKIGAEGGMVTISRERIEEAWQFRVKVDETTLYDVLSEEDRAGMGVKDFVRTEYAPTLQEALHRLDKYEWFRLCPLGVHPEFLGAVLAEVEKRGGLDQVARWRKRLTS